MKLEIVLRNFSDNDVKIFYKGCILKNFVYDNSITCSGCINRLESINCIDSIQNLASDLMILYCDRIQYRVTTKFIGNIENNSVIYITITGCVEQNNIIAELSEIKKAKILLPKEIKLYVENHTEIPLKCWKGGYNQYLKKDMFGCTISNNNIAHNSEQLISVVLDNGEYTLNDLCKTIFCSTDDIGEIINIDVPKSYTIENNRIYRFIYTIDNNKIIGKVY